MPTYPIQLKRNGTAAATPSSLLHGEVALNYADGKLFWKDASNVIQSFTFQAYALSSHTHAASDITSGTLDAARIANDSITYAKLQNVSATDRLLGRSSAGSGDVEEITCTAFGRSLIDDADAATARTTLSVQPTASPAFTGTVTAAAVTLSGVLLVTAGSASACGVAFSGDVNTGLAQIGGADTASLVTAGVERVRCTSGGTVEVRANSGSISHGLTYNENGGEIVLYDETQTAATLIDQISTDTRVLELVNGSNLKLGLGGSNTTGLVQFMRAGYQEAMRIDASGNVGVGNIVPTHRLDCNGEFRLRGTGASTEAGKLHLYWVSATNRATWTTDASGNALIETGASSPAERFRVGVNGRSQFFAASEKYGVQLNNGSTANGPFIGSAGADIFTVSASGGAELLRVDASGNTCIGSAGSSAAELSVFKDKNAARTAILIDNLDQRLRLSCYYESGVGQYAEIQSATDSESSFQNLLLQRQGGEVLIGTTTDNGAYKLQVNSQIYATNATIATSDARFKANVEQLTDATSVIEALRPVAFDFLPHEERNFATERQVGLIAQEAQSALAGTDYAESVVAQCGDHLGLAYEKLVPVLIKALQESNARIAALEERLNHA